MDVMRHANLSSEFKNTNTSDTLKKHFIAAALLTISACNSNDDADEPASSVALNDSDASAIAGDEAASVVGQTTASSLIGAWVNCTGNNELSIKRTLTFTQTRYKEKFENFSNAECSGTTVSDFVTEFGGIYTLAGDSTSESGLPVKQINMTSDELNGTPIFETAKVTRYNIVYTGALNQLLMGDFSGSVDGRPTKLEFELPLLLQ